MYFISSLNAVADTSGLRPLFVACCAATAAQVDAMDQKRMIILYASLKTYELLLYVLFKNYMHMIYIYFNESLF